jgi:hypothetical protein
VALIVAGTLLLAYGFEVHFCEFDLTCPEEEAGGGALRRIAFYGGVLLLVATPFIASRLAGHPRFILAGAGAIAAFWTVVAVWGALATGHAIGRNTLALGAACLVALPTPSAGVFLARAAAALLGASIAILFGGNELDLGSAAFALLAPLAIGGADLTVLRAVRS